MQLLQAVWNICFLLAVMAIELQSADIAVIIQLMLFSLAYNKVTTIIL